MKTYEVKRTIALTVQPGSMVILSDAQAAAVGRYIAEVPAEKPKKAEGEAKKKTTKGEAKAEVKDEAKDEVEEKE